MHLAIFTKRPCFLHAHLPLPLEFLASASASTTANLERFSCSPAQPVTAPRFHQGFVIAAPSPTTAATLPQHSNCPLIFSRLNLEHAQEPVIAPTSVFSLVFGSNLNLYQTHTPIPPSLTHKNTSVDPPLFRYFTTSLPLPYILVLRSQPSPSAIDRMLIGANRCPEAP